MGGQHALELMTGRGTDKFSRLFRKELVNSARISALDGLAGEDDGPTVNVAAAQSGVMVGVLHEMLDRRGIDEAVRQERGQHDGRAPDHLSVDDHKAAGQTK